MIHHCIRTFGKILDMYRTVVSVLLAVGLTVGGCAQKKGSKATVNIENATDSLSYAIGMSIAGSFEQQDLSDLNLDLVKKAMEDKFAGTPMMEPEACDAFVQQELKNRQDRKFDANKEVGEAWLAENAKKDGIQITASGLQYEIVTEGTGASPDENDDVTVHYKGTLTNGETFDSSYDRGTPATFGVNRVIKGWTEGLQLMKEGAKYNFYIPQELAYGANPRPGGLIEPFMPLVFEVELIQVTPKD